jgi:hypothetical protein
MLFSHFLRTPCYSVRLCINAFKIMKRFPMTLMGLALFAPCFIPLAGNNDQKELKKDQKSNGKSRTGKGRIW